jgi:HK97 gp10 family phage protein
MARRAQVQITGDKALIANIYKANERVGKALRSMNRRMARQTWKLARELSPVDTGRMKGSLTYEMSPDELVFDVFPDPRIFEAEGLVYYPLFVHEGTYRMPARPFLRWAYNEMEPSYSADVRLAIKTALREATK